MKLKITREELNERLSWPLDRKMEHFVEMYCEYFLEMVLGRGKGIYLSFSGGKDSQTAIDIIDRIHRGEFNHLAGMIEVVAKYPVPPKVFCNTGLEFPEIVTHVKSFENVVILKPKMGFKRVIKEIGVAVGSKKVAGMVARLKKYMANPTEQNLATRNLYLTGIKKDGQRSRNFKLPNKWRKLLDAPFKVSDKCCDVFKKEPFRRYMKETGRYPVYFTTAVESKMREASYLTTGCLSFNSGKEACRPFSIFTDKDVWEYHDRYNMTFCEVYYDRERDVKQLDGTFRRLQLEAETRTGCTFCLFGLHLDPKDKPNRIQRLARSHPKYYDIIVNKCGLGSVLEWLELPYKPFNKGVQKDLFCNDA